MWYNNANMRKLRLYFETSIINFAISNQVPAYRDITLGLLGSIKIGVYEAYISDVVVREILKSEKEIADKLMGVIERYELEPLEVNTEIEDLSQEYIKAGLIPMEYIEDAVHIAIGTFYELDAVVTWNFEHMIKLKTKKGIPAVNTLLGYRPIEIISPLEVKKDV